MFFHGSLLASAWGDCVLYVFDTDILRFMERIEKLSCALLLLFSVICRELRWCSAVRSYKEALSKQGKLRSITASLAMDETINPGRGELICVRSVLLKNVSSGWVSVSWHIITVVPCCTWGSPPVLWVLPPEGPHFHGAPLTHCWGSTPQSLGQLEPRQDGKGLAHLGAP